MKLTNTVQKIMVASIGIALSSLTQAQETMSWQQRTGEGTITLAYEVPETSDQTLVLTCTTGTRRFTVSYRDDRDRTQDGRQESVEFASRGGRASLRMRAAKQELDDAVVLFAETPLTTELIRVLSSGTLRVTLAGVTETIPLAAAQRGVAALESGCGGR